ncbi:PrpF domain-containing protein [Brevibacterium sp. UCMA 11754]|uniref:PrpF domain-containing protein n=1 Tax=Brevibacterium sp. UCMA 11754 TaxID=2749198 RepID=UPI001F38F88B|nr:PrpF domain-containing protein [Brevibacterium sp. UCMA 11754]MCF2570558.1 acetylornithine aminotransferase [Brevibacterium sp. UCMA 11754]
MTDWIDAAFVRGGTSKGLYFRADSLPELDTVPAPGAAGDTSAWDAIFCSALGSPDAFGRQLDGMGGGISSLSKVMVVSASMRTGVDLDYTFGQVDVAEAVVDYSGNCGNLSSGVVPFALLAEIVSAADGWHVFRLFNTNTDKLVDVGLTVVDGQAAVAGDFELTGVSGTGAPIELIYPDPAGSRTSGILPTGAPSESIDVDGRMVDVSMVDASLPVVIVPAEAISLNGDESPESIDANVPSTLMIEELRRKAAVRMGLCETPEKAPQVVPKVAVVTSQKPTTLLDGTTLGARDSDVVVRMISMGQTHKAVPGTGAMCLAAAAQIPGTIVHAIIARSEHSVPGPEVRLGTPSGTVTAAAVWDEEEKTVAATSLFRTARVLMVGKVAVTV